MPQFYALFSMHGDANKVVQEYNQMQYRKEQGQHNCSLDFRLQVKVNYPDRKGTYNYALPSVTEGNKAEALDMLNGLERQGLIEQTEADGARRFIETFIYKAESEVV